MPLGDYTVTDNPDSYSQGYDAALNTIAPNTTKVIADTAMPGEPWYQTLARALPMVAATYQQKELLAVQVERAKQGLPPLNMSEYAAGVQIGLSSDTQKLLLYAALGLGALFFFSRSRR